MDLACRIVTTDVSLKSRITMFKTLYSLYIVLINKSSHHFTAGHLHQTPFINNLITFIKMAY